MFKKALVLSMSLLTIWKYQDLVAFYDYYLFPEGFIEENILKPKEDKSTYKAF
jgi:hypothetical protein